MKYSMILLLLAMGCGNEVTLVAPDVNVPEVESAEVPEETEEPTAVQVEATPTPEVERAQEPVTELVAVEAAESHEPTAETPPEVVTEAPEVLEVTPVLEPETVEVTPEVLAKEPETAPVSVVTGEIEPWKDPDGPITMDLSFLGPCTGGRKGTGGTWRMNALIALCYGSEAANLPYVWCAVDSRRIPVINSWIPPADGDAEAYATSAANCIKVVQENYPIRTVW